MALLSVKTGAPIPHGNAERYGRFMQLSPPGKIVSRIDAKVDGTKAIGWDFVVYVLPEPVIASRATRIDNAQVTPAIHLLWMVTE